MKDRDWRALRGRLRRLRKPWFDRLGLKGWEIVFEYVDGPLETDAISQAVATTTVQWQYKSAVISYSLPALTEKVDEELEEMIVHEFLHILVHEMREGDIKHEERVVTELSRSFIRTFDLGKKAPR